MSQTSKNPRLNAGDDDLAFELVDDDEIGRVPPNDGTGFTEAQAYAYLAGDVTLASQVGEAIPSDLEANPLLAAGLDPNYRPVVVTENTGAMIALIPSAEDIAHLELEDDGVEPADALHLTILYLGEAKNFTLLQRSAIVTRLQEMALTWGTIAATGFGAAVWNPESDTPALVVNVGGCDCFDEVRDAVYEELESMMIECPEQHKPYVPHICLAYGERGALVGMMNDALNRLGPIVFDGIRIAFGTETLDIPLVYSETDVTAME